LPDVIAEGDIAPKIEAIMFKRMIRLCVIASIFTGTLGVINAEESSRPNVLFIAVDDMNDWVGCLGGYPGDVHSPHIDALAQRGTLFTNAHTASPVCNPSRTALMTGQMPSTTGVYNNGQWWRPAHPEIQSIPMLFRANGYESLGTGKIFHHTAGFNPPDQWDEFHRLVFNDIPWFRGVKLNYPWSTYEPPPEGFPFSGVPGLPSENDWGVIPDLPESDYDDVVTVDRAIEFLNREHDNPFFIACGVYHPHLPWYVPQEYFDLYPLKGVCLPLIQENDLDDVPEGGRHLASARRADLEKIVAAGKHREAVQAYLASISFADEQVERLITALDASPLRDNTIVVLWSDHGWHLGEKQHWHKSTLWENGTRVPLILIAPGVTEPNSRCTRPVGLIDIYPTLVDLCGLSAPHQPLDGLTLRPQLDDPTTPRERPVLITYGRGNHAVRSDRWRYIRYSGGGEELYDHTVDPHEWTNLIGDEQYASLVAELRERLPEEESDGVPAKGAYRFDPEKYEWERK
jgi:choline-sulfatase